MTVWSAGASIRYGLPPAFRGVCQKACDAAEFDAERLLPVNPGGA